MSPPPSLPQISHFGGDGKKIFSALTRRPRPAPQTSDQVSANTFQTATSTLLQRCRILSTERCRRHTNGSPKVAQFDSYARVRFWTSFNVLPQLRYDLNRNSRVCRCNIPLHWKPCLPTNPLETDTDSSNSQSRFSLSHRWICITWLISYYRITDNRTI